MIESSATIDGFYFKYMICVLDRFLGYIGIEFHSKSSKGSSYLMLEFLCGFFLEKV